MQPTAVPGHDPRERPLALPGSVRLGGLLHPLVLLGPLLLGACASSSPELREAAATVARWDAAGKAREVELRDRVLSAVLGEPSPAPPAQEPGGDDVRAKAFRWARFFNQLKQNVGANWQPKRVFLALSSERRAQARQAAANGPKQ